MVFTWPSEKPISVEVAERQQVEAVADAADLAIDLEAALQLAAVVFAEGAGERPLLARRHRRVACGERGWRRRDPSKRAGESERRGWFATSMFSLAPQPRALLEARIDSDIEFGSGLVFSTQPSTGRMMKKCAK